MKNQFASSKSNASKSLNTDRLINEKVTEEFDDAMSEGNDSFYSAQDFEQEDDMSQNFDGIKDKDLSIISETDRISSLDTDVPSSQDVSQASIELEDDQQPEKKLFEIDEKLLNKWEKKGDFDVEWNPVGLKKYIDSWVNEESGSKSSSWQ